MQGIIYDATKVKVCKGFYEICDYAKLPVSFADGLWKNILTYPQLYEELVYYIEHHTFLDKLKVCNYTLCDLYVWQMSRYNLIKDIGKNPRTCNKEKMVMQAFASMVELLTDPVKYEKRLKYEQGMDEK